MFFGALFMLAAFVLSIAALVGLVSPGWFARFSKTGKVYNRFVLFFGLNVASVVAMFYGTAIMSADSFSAAIGGVLMLSSLLLLVCSVIGPIFPGLFARFSKNGKGFSRSHLFLSFFCSAFGSLFVGAFLLPSAPSTEAAAAPRYRADFSTSSPASAPAVGLMAAADTRAASEEIARAASEPPQAAQHAATATAAASESSTAAGQTCRVVGIKDGDTFTCLTDGRRQITVRMAQIDAPEKGQPFGQKAKSTLSEYIHGQTVRLEESGFDRYGRTLAEVYDERGRNINMLMVQAGLAWAYKEYMTNTAYQDMQEEATRENRGLWSENGYIYPSDWRRGVRPQREHVATLPATEPQQRQRTGRLVQDRNARGFTCGSKRFCGQMNSCAEAMFYYRQCGVRRLDRDNDGVPCESIC
ncbi:thermonuclease family protein [Eikenella sp. Marseille-P7795]|uniref:thermonuclease family protein n=1 Tax=Eikenella sp. Marseille-P7795 TaxID=2866577 RepID=UPI001CE3D8C6|nr:thermonuclease family protein [Eikenella sp. Marseille-P7795]